MSKGTVEHEDVQLAMLFTIFVRPDMASKVGVVRWGHCPSVGVTMGWDVTRWEKTGVAKWSELGSEPEIFLLMS